MLTSELIAENNRAKKKPYLKIVKIGVYRKGLTKTEKGYKANQVRSFLIFEKENALVFSFRHAENGRQFFTAATFMLKAFETKAGEKRFRFYKLGSPQHPVQTTSPNRFRSIVNHFSGYEFPKSHARRLLSAVRAFAKKNGVKTKYMSDDAIDLIIQLCYPGTIGFDHLTMLNVTTGKFLLGDPTKLALATNGKRSKKLVYQAMKLHPAGVQTILRVAKYLRVNRSLDDAQKFLQAVIDCDRVTGSRLFDHSLTDSRRRKEKHVQDFSAKTMKILDPLSTEEICNYFSSARIFYLNDSLMMINQLSLNREGFDYTAIQYRTIQQLHDALVEMSGRRRGAGGRSVVPFEHYEFEPTSEPMKACRSLAEKFNDDSTPYRIIYPHGTLELQQYADKMKNCAFFYKDRIRMGEYIIFCIEEKQGDGEYKMKYMFGYRIYYVPNGGDCRFYISLDQAVGKCNADIDLKVSKLLISKINECLSPGAAIFA
jgi:hypothetical protein